MWDSINNGNWKTIENRCRSLEDVNLNLIVYTGVMDTFKLQNGKSVNLTNDNYYPVPKYLWKMVISRERNEGIAFMLLHNPVASDNELTEFKQLFGTDEIPCDRYRWATQLEMKNIRSGYFVCCKVQSLIARELVSGIEYVPTNILEFPLPKGQPNSHNPHNL